MLLLAPILLAAADTPGELAFLQEFYHKKLEEIDARIASEKTAPLFEKYDAALAGLEDSVSAEGDLEGLVAIRDERKRARTELGVRKNANRSLVENIV